MERKLAPVAAVLVCAVLLPACGGENPSAPSSTSSVESPPTPSGSDVSQLLGTWNVTVRLTSVTGSGCVADTMRSQIGTPNPYSLLITPRSVTLKSASGDRACTYSPRMDSSGFTTYEQGGYYTCEQFFIDFTCGDGTHHRIFTFGEDIAARVSGEEISGTWDAYWFAGMDDYVGFDMKAQFTGTRR